MKTLFLIIPWLILLISFAALAYFYACLPSEILIARGIFGSEAVFAPKSIFTVFRVPLIEMVCALAIELMRRKLVDANANYISMWMVLLYTVAFKSLFQAFEIISSGSSAKLFYYLTLGIVVAGITFALLMGRHSLSRFFRGQSKFSGLEKAVLFIFLIAYFGLAIIPIIIFR